MFDTSCILLRLANSGLGLAAVADNDAKFSWADDIDTGNRIERLDSDAPASGESMQ